MIPDSTTIGGSGGAETVLGETLRQPCQEDERFCNTAAATTITFKEKVPTFLSTSVVNI